uniref:Uncharacterized protein n=1 Tax=Anguilla anguilla TaxID=7936 RepID=A0A0E9PUK7_ANGAN
MTTPFPQTPSRKMTMSTTRRITQDPSFKHELFT